MSNSTDYGWIDSGVNLLDPRINNADVLQRAVAQEITHLVVIGSNLDESKQALTLKQKLNKLQDPSSLTSKNDGGVHENLATTSPKIETTAGIHPHYADTADKNTLTQLKSLCVDNKVRVIGECGLDFNRNFSAPKNQLYAFEAQLEIAAELGIGVYLHERDAFKEQIELLEKYTASIPFKVAHCFTGSAEQMNAYLELGCFIGITGWICDSKRGQELQNAVRDLPLEKMLLETDAPYLFPKTVRPRKSTNEPSYLPHIAKEVASIIETDLDLIKKHTFKNAYRLFFE